MGITPFLFFNIIIAQKQVFVKKYIYNKGIEKENIYDIL